MIPGMLYVKAPTIYIYFFYGRFILFGIVTAFIFLILNPSLTKWDRTVTICWLIVSVLFIIRGISISKIESVLFGLNILWTVFTMMSLLNSRKLIIEARKGFIWGAIMLVVISLPLSVLFPDFQIVSEVGEYKIARYGGLLNNAQQIAPYLLFTFIYLFYIYLQKQHKYYHKILLIPVIIMIFLSGSRTGILLLFFSVLLIFFLQKKMKTKIFFLFIFVTILSLVAIIDLNLLDSNIFSSLFLFYDKYILRGNIEDLMSAGYRNKLWEYGIEKFWESPIIGHGYKNIGPYYPTPFSFQKEFMPHNSFLMIALYIGLLGLIPFVILLLKVLSLGVIEIIKRNREKLLALIFVVTGILANFSESWILSFGYLPCWLVWLSIAEISLKERFV